MRCPNCGSGRIETVIYNDRETKPFGFMPACCGYLVFGFWGLLCGLCGARDRQRTTVTRRCADCGHIV